MTRFASPTILLCAIFCLGSCGSAPTPHGSAAGKGDTASGFVEVGPLPRGEHLIEASARPAYRVESYGQTTLELGLVSTTGPLRVLVEGPLPDHGDATLLGAGPIVVEQTGTSLSLAPTLAAPGVYRVAIAPAGAQRSPSVGLLSVSCVAGCHRPAMDQKTMLEGLRQRGALDELRATLEARLRALALPAQLQAELLATLDELLANDSSFEGIERFPTLPAAALAALRPALGLIDVPTESPAAPITGELTDLLGGCDVDRAALGPTPLAGLPAISRGHFPDLSLTRCQVGHSISLARILGALAAANGSSVSHAGQTVSTPDGLLALLLDSGHRIRLVNERTYANFLGLVTGEVDVRWPVWLDTGVALPSGENLVIPVGHSHHAWTISGPLIDAQVAFYMGVPDGAGFWPQVTTRPAWTGSRVKHDVSSDDGEQARAAILESIAVAGRYLRRIDVEKALLGDAWSDGYGVLGVCNDSTAVIEHEVWQTISTYPLLRAAALDANPPLGDGLDAVIALLPKDADQPQPPQSVVRRVLEMVPHDLGSPLLVDEALRAQLTAAAAMLP